MVNYARFDRWKDKFPISIVRVFSAVKYCGILATTSLITEDKSYKWNCSCLLPLSLLEVDGGEKWDEIVLVVSKTNLSNSIFKDSFLSWQGFTFLSEQRDFKPWWNFQSGFLHLKDTMPCVYQIFSGMACFYRLPSHWLVLIDFTAVCLITHW